MRPVLALLLAALAALVLRRRRRPRSGSARVVVAWRDGAELGLSDGTPEHERLVAVAGRVLA